MSNPKPTLLVTGASGHLGRRVVELLLEANAATIIAATRHPEKLGDFAKKGVIVRHADFNDPASLATAFGGVDRLLIISTDALGTRLQQHTNAVHAAEQAGVKHVIYTSIVNPGPESPILLAPEHYGTEQAIAATRMGYTFLRNNVYADVAVGALSRALETGQHFSACGDGKIGYVTREDCARAAAAALASNFEGRRILDVTGPEALSQADLAALASQISGKPVVYVPINLEASIQGMVGAGLPRPVAELYASFDAATQQGFLDVVSNAVQDLTGQPPMRMADFAKAALVPSH